MSGRLDWAAIRRDAEKHAKRGDYGLLIWLARKGRLDRRLQQLVADIFKGERKRPRGRSPNFIKKEMQREAIRELAWGLPPMSPKAKVSLVAEKLDVSASTVRSALRPPKGYVSLADLGARYRRPRPCN